jgi:hypothetical protein
MTVLLAVKQLHQVEECRPVPGFKGGLQIGHEAAEGLVLERAPWRQAQGRRPQANRTTGADGHRTE